MPVHLYLNSDNVLHLAKMNLWEKEEQIQDLIFNNPQLLLKDSESENASLFLISKEYVIPEDDISGNSFYLDFLLVGEDAIPTLVEVKRSSDTRIRREVVGQMLDYAARVSVWNSDKLQSGFKSYNEESPFANDADFWNQVESNLKAERIRLVFAADSIPSSLRTIIEFLDRNMPQIEVYGVELRQYSVMNTTVVSSNVVGGSSIKPSVSRARIQWDKESFISNLPDRHLGECVPCFKKLVDKIPLLGYDLSWRYGYHPGVRFFFKKHHVLTISCWQRNTLGDVCTLEVDIRNILLLNLLGDVSEVELRRNLKNFPSSDIAEKNGYLWETPGYLYIDLRSFSSDTMLNSFCDVLADLHSRLVESNISEPYAD